MTFAATLRAAMTERGPLCVGLDPHSALLTEWGLPDDPTGLQQFVDVVVGALGDRVAVIKPQSAFFERFGSHGIQVLENAITRAREAGAIVLLDAKRGDIGSTAEAYADAYFNPTSPIRVDAITVNPFLGFATLRPFIDRIQQSQVGVFVLAMTSNPDSGQVQKATSADGRTVSQTIVDEVAAINANESGWGSVGVVVGATLGKIDTDLSQLNGPILAPGLGAQGAEATDLGTVFGQNIGDVLPSVSRDVLKHGPDPIALRTAVDRWIADVRIAYAQAADTRSSH